MIILIYLDYSVQLHHNDLWEVQRPHFQKHQELRPTRNLQAFSEIHSIYSIPLSELRLANLEVMDRRQIPRFKIRLCQLQIKSLTQENLDSISLHKTIKRDILNQDHIEEESQEFRSFLIETFSVSLFC